MTLELAGDPPSSSLSPWSSLSGATSWRFLRSGPADVYSTCVLGALGFLSDVNDNLPKSTALRSERAVPAHEVLSTAARAAADAPAASTLFGGRRRARVGEVRRECV